LNNKVCRKHAGTKTRSRLLSKVSRKPASIYAEAPASAVIFNRAYASLFRQAAAQGNNKEEEKKNNSH